MKSLKSYTILGIILVSILGTLLHFAYEFTNKNPVVSLFVPVNESTWEHMKLIFFPMLLYTIYSNKKLSSEYPCVYSASSFGILLGTILIPILFYTYSGILGYNIDFVNILTFFISVLIAFLSYYKLTLSCNLQKYKLFLNIFVLLFFIAFIFFTIYPPDIGIFISPWIQKLMLTKEHQFYNFIYFFSSLNLFLVIHFPQWMQLPLLHLDHIQHRFW